MRLALLLALGIVAQGGRAVVAASARRGSLGAVNRRANANGRPGLVSHRSALRRLQDPIWQEPEDEDENEEPESVEESVEDLVDKVEEIVDALGGSNEAPSIDIDELMEDVAEVMEEAEPEESPEAPWEDAPGQQGEPGRPDQPGQSERFTTTPPPVDEPGESTPATVVGATEPAEEVTFPAAGETTEPAETEESTDPTSAETSEDETTEVPDGATDAPGEDATTTTTNEEDATTEGTSSGVNEGADDGGEGEEDEGEPLIASPAPTPKPIDSWYEPEKESQEKAPTNEPASDDEWGGEPEETDDPWGEDPTSEWGWAPEGPTNPPTPRPTYQYQPPDEGEDPIEEEKEADKEGFTDDGVFYHGLGGTVGDYLDGVESPQELAQDKNVEVIAGILVGVFLVLLLVTAHFVMNHPDGLCAGCCRLTLKVICCFTRTLCLPCRAICCKGSEQSHSRRSHTPMRTPFPTDLELA